MILVAGGNGFLGKPFCERLYRDGVDFLSLSRTPPENARYPSAIGDITDKEGLDSIVSSHPIRTVVNLAAMLLTNATKDPTASFQVNVVGSFNLLDVCIKRGVSRFVFASSFNAIGDLPRHKGTVDESTPCQPTDFYGASKLFVEQMGRVFASQRGIEFAAARIPMVVGPGKPSKTSAWRAEMFNRVRTGGNLHIEFAPEEVLPLAHHQDTVDALVELTLGERFNHPLYHFPYEAWRVADLGRTLGELRNDLSVTYGERRFSGAPPAVCWTRIREEFSLEPLSLRERLLQHMSIHSTSQSQ